MKTIKSLHNHFHIVVLIGLIISSWSMSLMGQEVGAEEKLDENASSGDIETVFAVQAKSRLHGGTFEFSPMYTASLNNRFTGHHGLSLNLLYHIKENIALELGGNVYMTAQDSNTGFRLGGHETSATEQLRSDEQLSPEAVKLMMHEWSAAANVAWTPISAKFSFHGVSLGTFDLFVTTGVGLTSTQFRPSINDAFIELPQGLALQMNLGAGIRFYFNDWVALRFEVRDYISPLSFRYDVIQASISSTQAARLERQSTFEVRNFLSAQIGLSFVIPTPWRSK